MLNITTTIAGCERSTGNASKLAEVTFRHTLEVRVLHLLPLEPKLSLPPFVQAIERARHRVLL